MKSNRGSGVTVYLSRRSIAISCIELMEVDVNECNKKFQRYRLHDLPYLLVAFISWRWFTKPQPEFGGTLSNANVTAVSFLCYFFT